LFICPLEIIFARKSALNGKLVSAMRCQQHAKEFHHMICNLTNIPHTILLTAMDRRNVKNQTPDRKTIATNNQN
jgi:hypothetical protein